MASRVLYGMSRQNWLPEILGRINATTGTPIYATLITTLIITVLALWLPIIVLAELTSLFILIIFSLMHLALISIKTNKQSVSSNVRQYHIAIPIVGLVTNAGFVLFYLIN